MLCLQNIHLRSFNKKKLGLHEISKEVYQKLFQAMTGALELVSSQITFKADHHTDL